MEYKHTFAGVYSNGNANWKDEFDTVYDWTEESLVVSKNEYKCYLGSKTVNYRLAIELQDSQEFDQDNPRYINVNMHLVPAFRNICREKRDDIIKFAGDANFDMEKYGKKDDLLYYQDAVSYGSTVPLYNQSYSIDDENDYENKINQILDDAANTYLGIAGMIGFYLDRPTNMLGMTGWDWLRQYCNNVSMTTILKDLKKRYVTYTTCPEATENTNV